MFSGHNIRATSGIRFVSWGCHYDLVRMHLIGGKGLWNVEVVTPGFKGIPRSELSHFKNQSLQKLIMRICPGNKVAIRNKKE
jgi:hypothetical protein